jgi:predicted NBD/HSP70 family sugar kinase
MGAPNGNFYTGTIEYAPNLRWKGIIPIAELMKKKFDLDTKLTNDANAAAVENKCTAAQSISSTLLPSPWEQVWEAAL